ncbi:MAG TPA: hypothetical protein VGK02_02355 [Candidatus Aquicultor sp.]|jgi:hypothetical protein
MAINLFSSAKSKIANPGGGSQGPKRGINRALIVVIALALTLALFEIVERTVITPVSNLAEDTSTATTVDAATNTSASTGTQAQSGNNLSKIVAATKYASFKARITTQTGFNGVWTQSGGSYRFENPSKQKVMIFSAPKHVIWIIDTPSKSAAQSIVATATATSFADLSAMFFVGAFSDTATTGTKQLDEMFPPDAPGTRLTFNKQGLPTLWEGEREGRKSFMRWDYVQTGNISPSEFELGKGIIVAGSAK